MSRDNTPASNPRRLGDLPMRRMESGFHIGSDRGGMIGNSVIWRSVNEVMEIYLDRHSRIYVCTGQNFGVFRFTSTCELVL